MDGKFLSKGHIKIFTNARTYFIHFAGGDYLYFHCLAMKPAAKFAIILVTAPDLKTARTLAKAALKSKLIACANLIPKIESHYRWQGKIESGAEVLLILKTQKSKLAALEKLILARHPYDTPEFLVLPLGAGNKKYLDWLAQDS
jgi:periplasmic divalent cation tolerance protein